MAKGARMDWGKVYEARFHGLYRERQDIWRVLCQCFFQKFVPAEATLVDVGAGYCEFINNIECGKKIAVDLLDATKTFANRDVTVLKAPSTDINVLADSTADVLFMSNLLEHLRGKEEVLQTLTEAWRILKPGGRLLILQPNIRYAFKEYWDFFDHHVPLSHKSLAEALGMVGFRVELMLDRFLPYTTKSHWPKAPVLVRMYLKVPLFWRVFGKQMFVFGRKPEVHSQDDN